MELVVAVWGEVVRVSASRENEKKSRLGYSAYVFSSRSL